MHDNPGVIEGMPGTPFQDEVLIRRRRWASEETGFAIIDADRAGDDVVLVGTLAHLEEGERVRIDGLWQDDKRYGLQVKVATAEPLAPTASAIENAATAAAVTAASARFEIHMCPLPSWGVVNPETQGSPKAHAAGANFGAGIDPRATARQGRSPRRRASGRPSGRCSARCSCRSAPERR